MPSQQKPQRVISAGNSTKKPVQLTAMPDADQESSTSLANTSPDNKPALTVSHSSLTFARTSPGRPTFIILTISQQHANTPVTLTTDEPEYFQLATDSQPAFAPGVTFIPSLTGTYVHIRYAANKMESHKGKLFIETPYESRTLTLEGSSWGLLPTLNTPSLPARITKPVHVYQVLSRNWRVWAISVAVAVTLAIGGYFYRSQLVSKASSDRSLTEINHLPSGQLNNNESLKATEYAIIEPKETQKVKSNKKQNRKKRATRRSSLDSIKEESPVTPPVSIGQKSPLTSKNSFRDGSQQANVRSRRKTVASPSSEESELERALNQKVQQ